MWGGDLGCTFADFSQFGDHLGGAWCHLKSYLGRYCWLWASSVRTSGSPGCPFGDLSGLWHLLGYTSGKSRNTFADLLGFGVQLSGNPVFYVHRTCTFRSIFGDLGCTLADFACSGHDLGSALAILARFG